MLRDSAWQRRDIEQCCGSMEAKEAGSFQCHTWVCIKDLLWSMLLGKYWFCLWSCQQVNQPDSYM